MNKYVFIWENLNKNKDKVIIDKCQELQAISGISINVGNVSISHGPSQVLFQSM